MNYFLGIDLGTSGVKCIVMAENGVIAGVGLAEQTMDTPHAAWAEQAPELWWETAKRSIRAAIADAAIDPKRIGGIGFSGQMLGAAFLDKRLNPIRPCLLWCDQRSAAERDEIEEELGLPYILEKTGNYPLTGYWLPKLLWMKRHEPENYEKIYKIVFPKDYIRLMLTGELATDVTDGGGSLLFDVEKRRWSWELIDKFEFTRSWFVEAVESTAITGVVRPDVADLFGFSDHVIVVGGGGDQPVGGIGNGIVEEGIVSSTIGTSGVVFACTNQLGIDTKQRGIHSFCHCVPDKWSVFGCTLAAGGSFKWLRETLAYREKEYASKMGLDVYDLMTLSASKSPAGSKGALFLPYMIGERTPYPDPYATGAFLGLTLRHGYEDMVRAVMEGITFSLRDSVEILKEFGVNVKQVRASGGGGKSLFWRQMQADIFDAEVITTTAEEGPGMGAAILAAVGDGAYKSVPEACQAVIRPVSSVEPIQGHVQLYEELYGVYRSLYPALKGIYKQHTKTQAAATI